jgi:hypothetical protein
LEAENGIERRHPQDRRPHFGGTAGGESRVVIKESKMSTRVKMKLQNVLAQSWNDATNEFQATANFICKYDFNETDNSETAEKLVIGRTYVYEVPFASSKKAV